MERLKNLHVWMFIPLLVVQICIFRYYWPHFSNEFWEIHFHYWLVTAWYILVIVQPYLIAKQKIKSHRTLGIFGFLLAGGVIFTGFSLLDLPLKLAENFDPNRAGPPQSFYYSTLIAEFFSMVAFAYAVAQGIIQRHNLQNHSWWLIASVFYMIVPALGRGMIIFWRAILPPENFSPVYVFTSTEVIYLILFFTFAIKFGKIKHWATILGVLLVVIRFISRPLGASQFVQEFLNDLIIWH